MKTFHEIVSHARACFEADSSLFKQIIVERNLERHEASKTN